MGLRPTRSRGTEKSYRKRYRALVKTAMRETGLEKKATVVAVIEWFTGQNGRWSATTVRQYRASIGMLLEDLSEAGHLGDEVMRRMRGLIEKGPRPKGSRERPQTSSRKRKTSSRSEWTDLVKHLGTGDWWDRLTAHFITVNLTIGARPSELETAALDRQAGTLTIENAKQSNGRSFGPTRTLDLAPICQRRPGFFDVVDRFLANLQDAYGDLADWARVRSRIADRMARACRACGIPRLSPYATRHQAIAAAKATGSPTEVAAFAGHASDRTATVHYARRASGKKLKMRVASPSPDDIVRIRRHEKTRHPSSREKITHPTEIENRDPPTLGV